MNPSYAAALETRLRWLEWAATDGPSFWQRKSLWHPKSVLGGPEVLALYKSTLEQGETFYMDEHFCRLVAHAREAVPLDLRFELDWLIRPAGWLYLAEPIVVPPPAATLPRVDEQVAGTPPMLIGAVGWRTVPAGTNVIHALGGQSETLTSAATQFLCFLDFGRMVPGRVGFGAWSYFLLRDGQSLGARIAQYEEHVHRTDPGGEYSGAHVAQHEMHWIYTALHLMAQRLSVRVRHDTDRATRRRLVRPARPAPPFITVVTLRRLEAARPKGPSAPRDWQWQWDVRG